MNIRDTLDRIKHSRIAKEKSQHDTKEHEEMAAGLPKIPYIENPEFDEEIIKEEGSEILSWILQLTDEQCKYEKPEDVKDNWENISSPEKQWLNSHYTYDKKESMSLIQLIKQFKKHSPNVDCTAKAMKQIVEEEGYSIFKGDVIGLAKKLQTTHV